MKRSAALLAAACLLLGCLGHAYADEESLLKEAEFAIRNGLYDKALEILERPELCYRADIQFQIALMYSEGVGTEKDDLESLSWLIRAIQQNHSQAVEYMALVYLHGLNGFEKNEDHERYWRELRQ